MVSAGRKRFVRVKKDRMKIMRKRTDMNFYHDDYSGHGPLPVGAAPLLSLSLGRGIKGEGFSPCLRGENSFIFKGRFPKIASKATNGLNKISPRGKLHAKTGKRTEGPNNIKLNQIVIMRPAPVEITLGQPARCHIFKPHVLIL